MLTELNEDIRTKLRESAYAAIERLINGGNILISHRIAAEIYRAIESAKYMVDIMEVICQLSYENLNVDQKSNIRYIGDALMDTYHQYEYEIAWSQRSFPPTNKELLDFLREGGEG